MLQQLEMCIFDSINNSIIKGHYAELFKASDSAVVTKKALSINLIDKDTLFISADTLLATGPNKKRIIRAYYDVRILKDDMRGRSDSLYLDKLSGLTKLLSKPLTKKQQQVFTEVDRNKSNPVIWFDKSQMSGNKILLMSNKKTNKLDSLKITGNVLIIEKDTLSEAGFNQIKGGLLDGSFKNGKLDNIIIKKNTEMIYYLYNDEDFQLIVIDKTTCSALKMDFLDGEINYITFLATPLINKYINNSNYFSKIYYCGDDHEEASNNPNFPEFEKELASTTDLNLATSQKLYERLLNFNKNTYKISAGVELNKFDISKKNLIPDDLKKITKPIIGYIGGLNEKLDTNLIL